VERTIPVIAPRRRVARRVTAGWPPRRLARFAAPLVTLVAIVAGWQAYVSLRDVPEYLVPGPGAVLARLAEDPGFFYGQGLITLTEAVLGLLTGGGIAFVVAIAMAHSRALERSILPWAIVLKVTPIVAVAPMFTIWFGFGTLPKVLIAALITFFPVLINAVTGLRAVNAGALDVLRSLHASPVEVFVKLRLPSSLPFLFASVKVAITLSLIGAVVAEWSGSGEGLGHVILLAHSNLDLPTLFAGVFTLASLGIALTVLVSLVERRLLFWHESVRDGRE
jgi:ABC-type nitrate/sulfonate/bicarbonate transport system permease component